MERFLSSAIGLCLALSAFAGPIDEAARLVKEGDYWGARQLLEKEAAGNAKATQTAQFNYLMGVCDYETGDYAKARKLLETAKQKGNGASNLYLGRLAFLDYDFEKAQELYGEFRKYRERTNQVPGEDVEESERQLMAAENALERVERMTVIDSIAVPVEGFFKSYKLPASAGRLLSPEEMPLKEKPDGTVMAFINEGGDYMIWGEPDSIGNVHLVETMRLTDGTWQKPVETPSELNNGGYADYPFMMPDGVTLYYASDGKGSMGGYDIYIVTRDPQTGEYLQPRNIGMPYNSPYDDYMLAIDEENGVGWWATDRNLLGDKLTIYVYKVNELRENFSPDSEDILAKAKLTDYRSTQKEEDKEDITALHGVIDNIDADKVKTEAEFYLPKGDGTYYTAMSQLPNTATREAMKRYVKASDFLKREEAKLTALQHRYLVNRADNVKQQILSFEKDLDSQRAELIELRSEVYKLLKSAR